MSPRGQYKQRAKGRTGGGSVADSQFIVRITRERMEGDYSGRQAGSHWDGARGGSCGALGDFDCLWRLWSTRPVVTGRSDRIHVVITFSRIQRVDGIPQRAIHSASRGNPVKSTKC
jgi:hypothetical protein